jgi:hypothetical protein
LQTPSPNFKNNDLKRSANRRFCWCINCRKRWQEQGWGRWIDRICLDLNTARSVLMDNFTSLVVGLGNYQNSFLYGDDDGEPDDPPPGITWNPQLIGIGNQSPRHAYLIAWHQLWHGIEGWHDGPGEFAGQTRSSDYVQIATGNGNVGFLQVIGLGSDGIVRWIAFQDGDANLNPNRPPPPGGWVLSPPGVLPYTQVAVTNGNDQYLQVVGAGKDGLAYHVA